MLRNPRRANPNNIGIKTAGASTSVEDKKKCYLVLQHFSRWKKKKEKTFFIIGEYTYLGILWEQILTTSEHERL